MTSLGDVSSGMERGMARRMTSWITAACILTLASARTALASDFSHLCQTSDGAFVMENGELLETQAHRMSSAEALPYTVLSETVEAEETGYCVSWAKVADGRIFDFQYRRSLQRITFTFGGARRESEVRCTLEADGLPANLDCDRRVITQRRGAASETPPGASLWEHNGSTVALVAEGNQRRFIYQTPREGLVANGVRTGTLLFEGQLDGSSYRGRAWIFTKRCGELSYAVNGQIEREGTRVVLVGRAPRVNAECKLIGRIDDRLVFDLSRSSASVVAHPPSEGKAPAVAPVAVAQISAPAPIRDLTAQFGGGCEPVDIVAWGHPALTAIRARKQARLKWAMLCRSRTLPVFGIDFDYDPQGSTRDFFLRLYDDVLRLSGGTGIAFVSIKDKLIIDVTRASKDGLAVDFRQVPDMQEFLPPQDAAAVRPAGVTTGPRTQADEQEERLFLARTSFSAPMGWTVRANSDQGSIGLIRPDGKAEIMVMLWPKARALPSVGLKQLKQVVVAGAPAVRFQQKIDGGVAEHIVFEESYANGSRILVSYRALGEPIEAGAQIFNLFLLDLKLNDSPPGGWTSAEQPITPKANTPKTDPFDGLDMSAFEKTR